MLAILYFTADWCGPCKVFGPRLEAFAKERGFDLKKINVETDMEATRIWEVQSLPTTIWLRTEDGGLVHHQVGAMTEPQLKKVAEGW